MKLHSVGNEHAFFGLSLRFILAGVGTRSKDTGRRAVRMGRATLLSFPAALRPTGPVEQFEVCIITL